MKINLDAALNELDAARQIDQDEVVANALFTVAVAYLDRGSLDEAAEALDEAGYLCRKMDNQAGQAQVALRQADLALARRDFAVVEQAASQAMEIFTAVDDVAGQVNSRERLAAALCALGREEEALPHLEDAVDALVQAGDQVGQVLLLQRLAPLYRGLGRFEQALDAYAALGRAAEAVGERQRVALALVGVGTIAAEMGRLKAALVALDRASAVYLALGQNARADQVREEIMRLAAQPPSESPAEAAPAASTPALSRKERS
jgi:tetratricopeptide (TPR) repeat protein